MHFNTGRKKYAQPRRGGTAKCWSPAQGGTMALVAGEMSLVGGQLALIGGKMALVGGKMVYVG